MAVNYICHMYPEVTFDTFVCDLVISQLLLLDKYVNSNTLVNAEHAVMVHHIRFINDIYVTDEHMDANFLIILDLFHQVGTGKYKVNIVGWVEFNIPLKRKLVGRFYTWTTMT